MKFRNITEDWTSVIIGFLLIITIISTPFFPNLPKFGTKIGWNDLNTLKDSAFTLTNFTNLFFTFLFFTFFAGLGSFIMGKSIKSILKSFPILFILSMVAQFIASNGMMKNLGLETVLFSLLIGLLIGNFFKLPQWFKDGLHSEFFIKIGLVLLGANVLFSEILQAGFLGILQSVIVVFSVWYFAYWIAKKLKIDDELGVMMASAVSICGVSAAIATAGAIKGNSKKLSYVISLVLIIAIPMMIFMPLLAQAMGLSAEVTGAWLGGSIDTTGAVVASGTIAGDIALKFSTIIKFSQNVLLGVAAFIISIFWAYRQPEGTDKKDKPTLKILWQRFPKFVLGFMIVSLIFSFLLAPETATTMGKTIKGFRSLWFNLAFICIGLETHIKELFAMDKGKPLYAFIIAQTFNVIVTLIVAYIIFGMIYPNI